ncbi:MAG: D-alanyl-D-alanine carboxypeptidase/D-alanyl-D-alanine-endopeptidase, partial [Nitrospinota bacterium]
MRPSGDARKGGPGGRLRHPARWWGLAAYGGLGLATLPLALPAWRQMGRMLGGRREAILTAVLLGSGFLVAGGLLVRKWERRAWVLAGLVAVAFLFLWDFFRIRSPIERFHFAQYGAFGLLAVWAFRGEDWAGWRLWAGVLALALSLGAIDEFVQYLLPSRVGEWRDIWLNAKGSLYGLGGSVLLLDRQGELFALRAGSGRRGERRAGGSLALLSALLALVLLPLAASAAPDRPLPTLKAFRAGVRGVLRENCGRRAEVGFQVRSLATGEVLYDHRGGRPLIPASNVKLVTTAAALVRLGPDYAFPTEVRAREAPKGGVLRGDLYLKGFGDPALVHERLWLLAREVAHRGVREVQGDLVADDAFFDAARRNPAWPGRTRTMASSYEAPAGALSLDFNVVTLYVEPGSSPGQKARVVADPSSEHVRVQNRVTTGARGVRPSLVVGRRKKGGRDVIVVRGRVPAGGRRRRYYVSVSDPPLYAARAFAKFLEGAGVRLRGRIRRGETPPGTNLVARTRSKPLSAIVRDLNKLSNNFIAEQVLKTLGAEVYGPPGSWEKGLRVVRGFLKELGVPEGQFRLADGSGFSLKNRLAPAALVRVLVRMYADFRLGPEYVASLGVAGVDGTLRRRLRGTTAERRIRAKTGLLRRVRALSGYAVSRAGEPLAFSILVNDRGCGGRGMRALQ